MGMGLAEVETERERENESKSKAEGDLVRVLCGKWGKLLPTAPPLHGAHAL